MKFPLLSLVFAFAIFLQIQSSNQSDLKFLGDKAAVGTTNCGCRDNPVGEQSAARSFVRQRYQDRPNSSYLKESVPIILVAQENELANPTSRSLRPQSPVVSGPARPSPRAIHDHKHPDQAELQLVAVECDRADRSSSREPAIGSRINQSISILLCSLQI